MHPDFALALVLAHETGHRLASMRQLRWSDVDTERRVIRWRAEADKIGFAHETVLSDDAVGALVEARRRQATIGGAWLFPADGASAVSSEAPRTRWSFLDWWRQAETAAAIPRTPGLGFHSLRRAFATELKGTPLPDLQYMGGWKSAAALLTCYMQPDEQTIRAALASRRPVSAREEEVDRRASTAPIDSSAQRASERRCAARRGSRSGAYRWETDREGFEPSRALRPHTLSRRAP